MNVQPKLPHDDDRTMAPQFEGSHAIRKVSQPSERRVPAGPRAYATWSGEETWPLELEVEPWRP